MILYVRQLPIERLLFVYNTLITFILKIKVQIPTAIMKLSIAILTVLND